MGYMAQTSHSGWNFTHHQQVVISITTPSDAKLGPTAPAANDSQKTFVTAVTMGRDCSHTLQCPFAVECS
jgi:hypothetical protein